MGNFNFDYSILTTALGKTIKECFITPTVDGSRRSKAIKDSPFSRYGTMKRPAAAVANPNSGDNLPQPQFAWDTYRMSFYKFFFLSF